MWGKFFISAATFKRHNNKNINKSKNKMFGYVMAKRIARMNRPNLAR